VIRSMARKHTGLDERGALTIVPAMNHPMNKFSAFDATDLKLIYRTLHGSLMDNIELMDSEFLHEHQTWLRSVARSQGVDTSDHGQWERWLGGREVACEQRMAGRQNLSVV